MVVSVVFDMWLINAVLEVAPLVVIPLRLIPMLPVWVFFPIVNRLGRIV